MLALTLSLAAAERLSIRVRARLYVCARERNESLAGERERSASGTDLGALLAEGATVEEALLAG